MKTTTRPANEIKLADLGKVIYSAESLSYLQKQFPWFTLAEIEDVAKNGSGSMAQLISDLERKSGKWDTEANEEF